MSFMKLIFLLIIGRILKWLLMAACNSNFFSCYLSAGLCSIMKIWCSYLEEISFHNNLDCFDHKLFIYFNFNVLNFIFLNYLNFNIS